MVDDEDAVLAGFTWSIQVRGRKRSLLYAGRGRCHQLPGVRYLHRAVLERVLGRPLVRGESVDHIDGDGLNNRRANLRVATQSQNAANARRRVNSDAPYPGVRQRRHDRWSARIRVRGRELYLGTYATLAEAVAVRQRAAIAYFGEYARG